MAEPPDYSDAAGIYRKSMEEALAQVDKAKEEAIRAKEKAINQELAAMEELHRIRREAEKHAEEFIALYQKQYDARIKNDTLMEVTEKLLAVGIASADVKEWLDVSSEMIAHAHAYLHFELLGDRMARVSYETQGRAGNVYFNWDGLRVKFPFEFGGGNTLVNIEIPAPEHWESETKIPIEQRGMVLEFIARQIIQNQAPDHLVDITSSTIRIYSVPHKSNQDE